MLDISLHATGSATRRRSALLHGVSLTALVVAGIVPARAGTAYRSLNQALALASHAAQLAVSPAAGVTASQQAALGTQNMARALTQYRSLQAALNAAAVVSHSPAALTFDGYGPGKGLQPADGAASGNALWSGAYTPDDRNPLNKGGVVATPTGTAVTIQQAAPVAELSWKTFNVGPTTSLTFDQRAGGAQASSWVVINTVQDTAANGSQILGAIHALGKVYVLNHNGIAFGAGSTINVGSLVAATADIAATAFSTTASGQTSFNLYGAQVTTKNATTNLTTYYQPTFVNGSATAITVDRGASIQTNPPVSPAGGGYVFLFGGNVINAGAITTQQGQTVLAAGTDFTLRQGYSGSITTGNTTSTTLGSEVATTNLPTAGTFTTGSVANSGIVFADQGDISLVGHALTQSGVLMSTTTVNTRGTIHLLTPSDGTDTTSSVTLAANSLTEILPEDNGQTALDSQRAANVAGSLVLNAARQVANVTTNPPLNTTNILPDQLGESRVEVSTGGAVDVASGALVQVPGGQVAIGGGSQVTLASGATLDVSGTTAALLPASVNDLLVNVQPFQLRDSAGNRTGPLRGTNVYVDARTLVEVAAGAYAGNINTPGSIYTPGGLVEVGGFLGQVPRGIEELTALGGTVTLQAVQRTVDPTTGAPSTTLSGTVTAQPGSIINLQGGTVSYQSGAVRQSYVQTTDGVIYNVNYAPGNLVYSGVYGGLVVQHPRWRITDIYINPLLTPGTIVDPAYTVGRDAGALTVNASTASLGGAIYAGVTFGQDQNGPRPAGVSDPYLLAQTVVPLAGSLSIGNYITGTLQPVALGSTVTFQSAIGTAASGGTATQAPNTIVLDSGVLTADGFASVTLQTSGDVTVSAPVTVADGGRLSLTGANIAVDASLTARGGVIALTDEYNNSPVGTATSFTLAAGAALDTHGIWTNVPLDPVHIAGLGHANGGTVSIVTAGGVDLAAGSRIDVSSGGGILAGGRPFSAAGGSINIVSDLVAISGALGTATVTLDAAFVGYGGSGGGTLSLTAPAFQIGAGTPDSSVFGTSLVGTAALAPIVLSTGFFSSGFSSYAIDGIAGLEVLPGAQVTAVEPIYELANGLALPSGSDPSQAYTVVLPALYTPVRGSDVLAERSGANITLAAFSGIVGQLSGGALEIGTGATVAVDPNRSISLVAFDELSVLGTLTAHGGTISAANTRYNSVAGTVTAVNSESVSEFGPGVSIWLGQGSVLDVSGVGVVENDSLGRRFGQAGAGGSIALGGYDAAAPSTWAEVIVRPGARLDADGGQATVDVVPGATPGTFQAPTSPVTLVGNGGTISARSLSGVSLDGALTARAGGAGASGGVLNVEIDPFNFGVRTIFGNFDINIPTYVFQPRQIVVTQATVDVLPASGLAPGDVLPGASYGLVRVSQQEIDAGGFASLDLAAPTASVIFDGNVSLSAARQIIVNSGSIGDSSPNASVGIAAPHVYLAGYSPAADAETGLLSPLSPVLASFSTLTVSASLIDLSDLISFGGPIMVSGGFAFGTPTPYAPGFGPPQQPVGTTPLGFTRIDLVSGGDIRFFGNTDYTQTTVRNGTIETIGDITFRAAQLYPTSGVSERVIAGYNSDLATNPGAPQTQGRTITVQGSGAVPQAPYSVGGTLTLEANTILQDGVVRAPEGQIDFTDGETIGALVYPSQVVFGPGSVTSVSLLGQSVPFGGTADGVTYNTPTGVALNPFTSEISVQAENINVQDGATLDLRGGGILAGEGFVFGRGGTADVLTTPLLDLTGGALVANATAQVAAIVPQRTLDPVYAILPGYTSAYAPAAYVGDPYTPTVTGQQIRVAAGEVPGLAAGTYTLLPAIYALQPGGYRVELTTSGTLPAGSSLYQGNFTTAAPVTLSIANTGIVNPVATIALFTSETNVHQLSQYDDENYNTFAATTATQFGGPRPFLPQDAKNLLLFFPAVPSTGGTPSLDFAPAALLDAPDTGGYGSTVEINLVPHEALNSRGFFTAFNGNLDIGAPTDVAPLNAVVLPAATLDLLRIPRLVLGGLLQQGATNATIIDVSTSINSVAVLPGASLTAGEVLLAASPTGQITVEPTGTVSTIGAGPTAYDSAAGFLFNNDDGTFADVVVDIGNGRQVFAPNTLSAQGASVVISDGSTVLAGGGLNIVAPAGANVTIGNATLGAKYASLAVAAINIGSPSMLGTLATELPAGLSFTPQSLSNLLNGNPKLNIPAATELTLTASQEVNILGSVTLDTGSTSLVLNTPAIYGVGSSADTATIVTAGFTWSGVPSTAQLQVGPTNLINTSALPGGQIVAGLAGAVSGTLNIRTAGPLVLGYGPQTQPNDQLQLDRLVVGFGTVILQSATEITANNKSALSVYATQGTYGVAGSGGNLTLSAPLITTDSSAVLSLTAGGALALTTPVGAAPAATAGVTTLGGEIDLAAASLSLDTALSLHSGRLDATAAGDLTLLPASSIDLSGRAVHLLDQTVYSPGGTLVLESTAGNILAAGATNVSSPGASAGIVSVSALSGDVNLDATLAGSAGPGQVAGAISIVAGTLSTATAAAASDVFGLINQALDTENFTGGRSFEIGLLANGPGAAAASTPDILIANAANGTPLLVAHVVSVTADRGAIDVTGEINASGANPGSISLSAAGNLTLEPTAFLDAHATTTATDHYGSLQPIDAENRAHVTLTTSAGSLLLGGGRIDLRYLDNNAFVGVPQGQLVLNAPRVDAAGALSATAGYVAISASAPLTVEGAQSIALYAWTKYAATDAIGSVAESTRSDPTASLTLQQIDLDNQAFFANAYGTAASALAGRLTGLSTYGTTFHLRPGVEIDSSTASTGDLTIVGDLNLVTGRYSDMGYGTMVTGTVGSGEPGSIVFRAQNDLIVNGSVTDGFANPPDQNSNETLPADNGWVAPPRSGEPLSADVFLPSSLVGKAKGEGQVTAVALGKGTTFATSRAISLNYPITIKSATIASGVVIPFSATLAADVVIPIGGFVTTAAITTPTSVIPAGTNLTGGMIIPATSTFAAGTVLPSTGRTPVTLMNGTFVPAGTLLSVFAGTVGASSEGTIELSALAALPVNAFIPSSTRPNFVAPDGTPNGAMLKSLTLRPDLLGIAGNHVQGYVYALAPLLPAGSQSWNLDFVAGADAASANVNAVQPRSALDALPDTQPVNTAYQGHGNLVLDDEHYFNPPGLAKSAYISPAFSVIRTGTGDLTLAAGGNFDQSSLFGIYTAGTQSAPIGGTASNNPYNLPRQGISDPTQGLNGKGLQPGGNSNVINRIFNDAQANYPTQGGDVSLLAQGSVTGDLLGVSTVSSQSEALLTSDGVGNWLWRQGSATLGQPSAWWINFGSLAVPFGPDGETYLNATNFPTIKALSQDVELVGFQGIGALGGGNVSVVAGLNAGQTTDRNEISQNATRSEGLVIAVGATGRELADGTGTVVSTGGGNLTVRVGGTLNPLDALAYGTAGLADLNGAIIDLRGSILVQAGAAGRIESSASYSSGTDPRPIDPFTPYYGTGTIVSNGGLVLVPGDATVNVETMRDLVVEGVGDAGRVAEQNLPQIALSDGTKQVDVGLSAGFTVWTPDTSVNLFSAGGNVTPTTQQASVSVDTNGNALSITNVAQTDLAFVYPTSLMVTAAAGNIVYGEANPAAGLAASLLIAPSVNEQVAFLAGRSIYANGFAVDLSGADPAGLSTPQNPAFFTPPVTRTKGTTTLTVLGSLTNILTGSGTTQSPLALFATEPDTPTVNYLSAAAQAAPALFYAAGGDIVGLTTGTTEFFQPGQKESLPQWYFAAKPVRIEALNDIVASGTRPSGTPDSSLQQNSTGGRGGGNLFLNNSPYSISVVSAGRDILSGYFYVGGPGLLEVEAGRNIQQIGTDGLAYGSIKSLGSLLSGAPISLSGGAGIEVAAGLGSGASYTAFADLYLNQANQANSALQITDPANVSKVQQTYGAQLLVLLQSEYGYTGTQAGALSYFLNTDNVPLANQQAFLRDVFYNELLASGQQYNDPTSRFSGSYVRGRQAIDTLLPGTMPGTKGLTSSNGVPAGYVGSITMASGKLVSGGATVFDAGVATEHGGDIQVLEPGGQVVLGTSGTTIPGGGTGLITNGFGNIDVFSNGSVLLGQSRIFTNAGGNIQIWSAAGDINAGIGARTSLVFSPPVVNYDSTGGLVDSPSIPTTGAGIATQQPLPSIPAGNIDLTAPLGTIDAGEAGVRSSGNINLAALAIANAAGITSAGKTTGIVSAPSVSASAAAAAGAAAGAATNAAASISHPRAREQEPSLLEVEVLSIAAGESEEEKRRRKHL